MSDEPDTPDDKTARCPFCAAVNPVQRVVEKAHVVQIPHGGGGLFDLLGPAATLIGGRCTCKCGAVFLVDLIAVQKGPDPEPDPVTLPVQDDT